MIGGNLWRQWRPLLQCVLFNLLTPIFLLPYIIMDLPIFTILVYRLLVGGLIFVKMAGRTATVLKNLQLSCQKIKLCPALVSYLFIFNLPFVLCNTYCVLFFQNLSFKPQNTTLIRFNRSYQTGKYPFSGFNFFITIHTLESED